MNKEIDLSNLPDGLFVTSSEDFRKLNERIKQLEQERNEFRKRVAELEMRHEAEIQVNYDKHKLLSTLLKASEGMEKALDNANECIKTGLHLGWKTIEWDKCIEFSDKQLADFRAVKEEK